MKSEIELKSTTLSDLQVSRPRSRSSLGDALLSRTTCLILAFLGIFGGISSLIVGLICIVIHSVVSGDRVFDRIGTILLIVAIPMLLGGAIFLDEIEGKK